MSVLRFYNHSANYTVITNRFIDTLMPSANGEFVKVYLYLLRCGQANMAPASVSELADLFNNTENDILRALKYWEKQLLIRLHYGDGTQLEGIEFLDSSEVSIDPVSASSGAGAASSIPAQTTSPVASDIPRRTYTADELQEFQQNPEIMELFFIIESYLKRTLSASDTNMVLFWYDKLGFAVELIEYLVEYCLSKGHSSMRYMDKVALGWAESDIRTVEQAKANASSHSQLYYAVIKSLGIHGRNLVPLEMDFIQKWNKTWGMDQELILEACSRTISATHQPSFEYADGILTKWHNADVKKLDDVKRLDEEHSKNRKASTAKNGTVAPSASNRFNNFHQRSYDEQELEKMLLNSNPF